jgi:hypothetical protein
MERGDENWENDDVGDYRRREGQGQHSLLFLNLQPLMSCEQYINKDF